MAHNGKLNAGHSAGTKAQRPKDPEPYKHNFFPVTSQPSANTCQLLEQRLLFFSLLFYPIRLCRCAGAEAP